jgi:hypothetical protein
LGQCFVFLLNEELLAERNLVFVAREWKDMHHPFELIKNQTKATQPLCMLYSSKLKTHKKETNTSAKI